MKNKLIILLIGCLWLFSGCKQTEYVYKTEYITKHQRDSIYLRDSIFVNQYMKGDTVFRDKTVIQIEYKDRFHNDTIIKNDTIRIPVKHYVKEKSKKQNWKFLIGMILPVITYIGYKLIRKKFLLIFS